MNEKTTTQSETINVDYSKYESPSNAIAASIAAIENTDITELEPLFASFDSEALDRLFAHPNTNENLVVDLLINGYAVTIQTNGKLIISEPDRS